MAVDVVRDDYNMFNNEVLFKRYGSLLDEVDSISKMKGCVRRCVSCKLHEKCKAPVPPQAPSRPVTVVCGQNPGFQEDKHGVPFFYKAPTGKYLTKILAALDIDRSDTWITNAAHCHTLKNRRLTLPDIKACSFWKVVEFSLMDPSSLKFIILFGQDAYRQFFPKDMYTLSDYIGAPDSDVRYVIVTHIPMWDRDVFVLPLYHPGFFMRQPSHKKSIKEVVLWARSNLV